MGAEGMDLVGRRFFSVAPGDVSHALMFDAPRFDYTTEGEAGGQLVLCRGGELDLFGHTGEWIIPKGHMVYIPANRWFRLRARVAASGTVVKFCHGEVAWRHNGCWVGPVDDFARQLIEIGLKWDESTAAGRRARCYFVTLGDLLPDWFLHERILWTPYAHGTATRRAIDFARMRGPGVSLPEVAEHVGMSERTLRRHMQAELGQSWREFIREMRMNRAMEMLRKDRKSVTETAFEVGFSSSSAFSSAFLEYVGKSPAAYARSFRTAGLPTRVPS